MKKGEVLKSGTQKKTARYKEEESSSRDIVNGLVEICNSCEEHAQCFRLGYCIQRRTVPTTMRIRRR